MVMSLRMSIVNMFRKLKEDNGVNIVYITHDLATAYYTADRIAIMPRGWIVEMGPVERVLGQPLHPYTQLLKQRYRRPTPDKVWTEEVSLRHSSPTNTVMLGVSLPGAALL